MGRRAIFSLSILLLLFAPPAWANTKRIVILGDSLVAGYGLSAGEDYPAKLQAALIKDGHDVKVDNAGVSGDTSAGGKARLEWSITGEPAPSLVIIELGANDMLRGIEPEVTKDNLHSILATLQQKKIPTLIYGMKAAPNLGPAYRNKFDGIYPELAEKFNAGLYPFFLEDVAANPSLNQADGIHPTAEGIDLIVDKTLPLVKKHLSK